MVQIDPAKDLAAMFNPPQQERYSGFRYGQGTILSWNPATFENQVSFRNLTLTNLPILGKIDGLSLKAGDVVGLMGWAPNGGFGAWWILGELGVPPLANPVAVEGGANFLVRDGGAIVTINDDDNEYILMQDGELRLGPADEYPAQTNSHPRIHFIDTSPDPWLRLRGGDQAGVQLVAPGDGTISLIAGDLPHTTGEGHLNATTGGQCLLAPDDGFSVFTNTCDVQMGIAGGGDFRVTADDDIFLDPDGSLQARVNDTTAQSANLFQNGTLSPVRRSTSARKYKTQITDLVVDPESVLRLRPRTWRGVVDVSNGIERWGVGLVAEEVIDAGLGEFVEHDHEGNPDYVAYDRLSVALLELARSQERRLAALEERVSSLDGQQTVRESVTPTRLPKRCYDPPIERQGPHPRTRWPTDDEGHLRRKKVIQCVDSSSDDPNETGGAKL